MIPTCTPICDLNPSAIILQHGTVCVHFYQFVDYYHCVCLARYVCFYHCVFLYLCSVYDNYCVIPTNLTRPVQLLQQNFGATLNTCAHPTNPDEKQPNFSITLLMAKSKGALQFQRNSFIAKSKRNVALLWLFVLKHLTAKVFSQNLKPENVSTNAMQCNELVFR